MNNSVFSNKRTIYQPKINIDGLKIDCKQTMDGRVLLSKLPTDSIPLVFFDPQYRSILDKQAYGNEGKRQKRRAELPQMSYELIREFLKDITRILLPSGHLMLWIDKYMLCTCYNELLKDLNLKIVDMMTWNKQKMGMGYRTRRFGEYLLILQKPPIKAKGVWKLHNIPDVWDEKVCTINHTHSKPVELQKQLILATTNEDDLIVDPSAGSYSVLKATQSINRHFIGCDISEDINGIN
jgi:site-specific DNA-methyltransferase (adenine-specific)